MLIYTENITPRLKYVLNFIFRDVYAADYRLTDKVEEFRNLVGAKINYSSANLEECYNLPVSGLLS